jgi:hypothetical protein
MKRIISDMIGNIHKKVDGLNVKTMNYVGKFYLYGGLNVKETIYVQIAT